MPSKTRKPTGPTVNEDILLATLSEPYVPQNSTYIRHACAAALLDAFDRRVQREYFVKVIDTCFNLNEKVRQHEIMSGILADAQAQKLTLAKLQEVTTALNQRVDEWRGKLLKMMDLINQMPTEEDAIN